MIILLSWLCDKKQPPLCIFHSNTVLVSLVTKACVALPESVLQYFWWQPILWWSLANLAPLDKDSHNSLQSTPTPLTNKHSIWLMGFMLGVEQLRKHGQLLHNLAEMNNKSCFAKLYRYIQKFWIQFRVRQLSHAVINYYNHTISLLLMCFELVVSSPHVLYTYIMCIIIIPF